MPKPQFYETDYQPRTLIVGLQSPINRTKNIASYYEEFTNLVRTLGTPYEDALYLKIRTIDRAYFISRGKLDIIKDACAKNNIEKVIISDSISPQQARNLHDYLDCTIVDRTQLILDIFENAAISAEGKTQVAIARLQHEKTRLAGQGISLDQQTGATGQRGGPGEKLKERDKRHIEEQIAKLKRQLEKMHQSRETQRKKRLQSTDPILCLIGYTNAGKSTILNTLTNSNVLAENKLFATLDTTVCELYIDGKKKGMLSDTVGFIQQLPTQLIEAFKSTLSELQYADLLIQVVDFADNNWQEHIKVVNQLIKELKVEKPMLYLFNKADAVENIAEQLPLLEPYQPHVVAVGTSKEGLTPFIEFLRTWHKQ
jgi:GTP-binding protein HflX